MEKLGVCKQCGIIHKPGCVVHMDRSAGSVGY